MAIISLNRRYIASHSFSITVRIQPIIVFTIFTTVFYKTVVIYAFSAEKQRRSFIKLSF